jgi:hypothetical protein
VNHGDAAPIIANGIIPASFLLHGARLLKKKKCRFLFVCLFCLGAVIGYRRCLGAVLGYCCALSPRLSGHHLSSQLINFWAAPSSAIIVSSCMDSPAIAALRD